MTYLYQLAVLGAPTETQIIALKEAITHAISKFNLQLGNEVGLEILPTIFKPHLLQPSAAVFFAGTPENPPSLGNLEELLERGIPVLPVLSNNHQLKTDMPDILQPLHYLNYADGEAKLVSAALLECVGLLVPQRRVFISYRRDEANEAASQLYKALSALNFDVYLDTHETASVNNDTVSDAADAMCWHKLYDSDVLLMLDTPAYFESRWSSAEFGRVLAKGISILRVDWPGANPSGRSAVASVYRLAATDVSLTSGRIEEQALKDICLKIEEVRSQNHAVRTVNMLSSIRIAIQKVGGKMLGVSSHKAVHLQLPDGERLTVYPAMGVPTPLILSDALARGQGHSIAVVYDPIGLHQKEVAHLDWLENNQSSLWIKATEATWQFGHWTY